jgi:hypothetical protein
MSHVTKIRKSKDDRLERHNLGRVNPNDTSFYSWVKHKLGYLDLLCKRKNYDPRNVLQWALPEYGQLDNNTTISSTEWYGLKFSREVLRGDLAFLENVDGYDVWSFHAGIEGVYKVGCVLKLYFATQNLADYYGASEWEIKIAINGNKLIDSLAYGRGINSGTYYQLVYMSGLQNVWLNAGDRMSLMIPIVGSFTPELKDFTTYGHVSVNYDTKQSKRISEQYSGEEI